MKASGLSPIILGFAALLAAQTQGQAGFRPAFRAPVAAAHVNGHFPNGFAGKWRVQNGFSGNRRRFAGRNGYGCGFGSGGFGYGFSYSCGYGYGAAWLGYSGFPAPDESPPPAPPEQAPPIVFNSVNFIQTAAPTAKESIASHIIFVARHKVHRPRDAGPVIVYGDAPG